MNRETQISATISAATKELLEQHARATGVKKGRLIEQALRHHLRALQELPLDIVVHPRIVVSRRSGEELLTRLASPNRPRRVLRKLMKGDGD
jgi:uncharacterized protein (DUF1778 family)